MKNLQNGKLEFWKSECDRGCSLIPLNGKVPIEKEWQRWGTEHRPFDPAEFSNGRNAGLPTGPLGGLVLDVDNMELFQKFAAERGLKIPVTREVFTGGGGYHYYFRYPQNGKRYTNRSFKKHGFDIRGLGGQVVAAGSTHPETGREYTISCDAPIAEAPQWFLELCEERETMPQPNPAGPDVPLSIEDLKLSDELIRFIKTGDLGKHPSRSEAIGALLERLLSLGVSEPTIINLFETSPCGEKYREKRNGRERWLQGEFKRCRQHMAEKAQKQTPQGPLPLEGSTGPIPPFAQIAELLKEGEVGIAKLLTMLWKNKLRYDAREGRWYLFQGHSWARISDERVLEAFDDLRLLFERKAMIFAKKKIQAAGIDKTKATEFEGNEKICTGALKIIGDISRRAEIVKLCRSEGTFLGYAGPFDANPFLIACTNGVLNLETLEFRDGRPEDNIRTSIPTEWKGPDEPCPTWEDALWGIFDEDEEVIEYVHHVLGYCLSGLNVHHILWIWEGKGRNGKGLIVRMLEHVLGPFIGHVDRELLLERKHGGRQSGAPAPDILALQGKRCAFVVETAEGRKFDPGKMKWLTGGDTLTARGLYSKDITTFPNQAKLHLQTNFRPHISGGDYAAWQRIVLLPFHVSFVPDPSPDPARKERKLYPYLEDELRKEAPGILAWLVQGFIKYRAGGLTPPDSIRDATGEYRKEEDLIGRFVEERLERYEGNLLPAGECYADYREWCENQGMRPKHNTTFGKEMGLHIEKLKKGHKTFYRNVRLAE